jgi:hypothetical protein
MLKRWSIALVAAVTLLVSFVTAAPAHALDQGGDGDPMSCANAYTVKSAPIYGVRGPVKGVLLGYVEIRWSSPCGANWSRVIIYGSGAYSNWVTVDQEIDSEGRTAHSVDTVKPGLSGSTTWTRYLRLQNSQSRACAYASLSSDFGTLNFHTVGASVCA